MHQTFLLPDLPFIKGKHFGGNARQPQDLIIGSTLFQGIADFIETVPVQALVVRSGNLHPDLAVQFRQKPPMIQVADLIQKLQTLIAGGQIRLLPQHRDRFRVHPCEKRAFEKVSVHSHMDVILLGQPGLFQDSSQL